MPLASAPLTVAQTGTFVATTAPKLPVGVHRLLSFAYPGDEAFGDARSATVDVEVAKGLTSPRVSSSQNPAAPGTVLTFAARVDPVGGAAGRRPAPGSSPSTASRSAARSAWSTGPRRARRSRRWSPAGTRSCASYSGDANFEASSDEVENGQQVNRHVAGDDDAPPVISPVRFGWLCAFDGDERRCTAVLWPMSAFSPALRALTFAPSPPAWASGPSA